MIPVIRSFITWASSSTAAAANNNLVSGLNADLLDGHHASEFAATPGGSTGSVQFNNNGVFAGFGNWDGSTFTVRSVAGGSVDQGLFFIGTDASGEYNNYLFESKDYTHVYGGDARITLNPEEGFNVSVGSTSYLAINSHQAVLNSSYISARTAGSLGFTFDDSTPMFILDDGGTGVPLTLASAGVNIVLDGNTGIESHASSNVQFLGEAVNITIGDPTHTGSAQVLNSLGTEWFYSNSSRASLKLNHNTAEIEFNGILDFITTDASTSFLNFKYGQRLFQLYPYGLYLGDGTNSWDLEIGTGSLSLYSEQTSAGITFFDGAYDSYGLSVGGNSTYAPGNQNLWMPSNGGSWGQSYFSGKLAVNTLGNPALQPPYCDGQLHVFSQGTVSRDITTTVDDPNSIHLLINESDLGPGTTGYNVGAYVYYKLFFYVTAPNGTKVWSNSYDTYIHMVQYLYPCVSWLLSVPTGYTARIYRSLDNGVTYDTYTDINNWGSYNDTNNVATTGWVQWSAVDVGWWNNYPTSPYTYTVTANFPSAVFENGPLLVKNSNSILSVADPDVYSGGTLSFRTNNNLYSVGIASLVIANDSAPVDNREWYFLAQGSELYWGIVNDGHSSGDNYARITRNGAGVTGMYLMYGHTSQLSLTDSTGLTYGLAGQANVNISGNTIAATNLYLNVTDGTGLVQLTPQGSVYFGSDSGAHSYDIITGGGMWQLYSETTNSGITLYDGYSSQYGVTIGGPIPYDFQSATIQVPYNSGFWGLVDFQAKLSCQSDVFPQLAIASLSDSLVGVGLTAGTYPQWMFYAYGSQPTNSNRFCIGQNGVGEPFAFTAGADGGMIIGTAWTSVHVPPAQGAIISGAVGIGASTVRAKLHINGSVNSGSAGTTETLTAPLFGWAGESFNSEAMGYPAGTVIEYRVYCSKLAGDSTKFYSDSYTGTIVTINEGSNAVYWGIGWWPDGATGVRILRNVNGAGWNDYKDFSLPGASETDIGIDWISVPDNTNELSAVIPYSPYTWGATVGESVNLLTENGDVQFFSSNDNASPAFHYRSVSDTLKLTLTPEGFSTGYFSIHERPFGRMILSLQDASGYQDGKIPNLIISGKYDQGGGIGQCGMLAFGHAAVMANQVNTINCYVFDPSGTTITANAGGLYAFRTKGQYTDQFYDSFMAAWDGCVFGPDYNTFPARDGQSTFLNRLYTSKPNIVVKRHASQTQDLQQWRADDDTVVARVDYRGILFTTNVGAAVTTKTANYAVQLTDSTILCNAASGAITLLLPSAASATNLEFRVKKVDSTTNTVSLQTSGSDKIDGDSINIITDVNTCVSVVSDGFNWYMV